MIRKIIDSAIWIFFAICFVVTGVVAIAQNSVPGDSTYKVKTGFEKIVLSGYRLVHKDTDYQIDLTKLRFKESQQVLKSPQSGVSLANLNLQILSTQENITQIEDTKKKSTYAKKYISTLQEIKTQLDYEKLAIVSSTPTTSTAIAVSSTPTTTTQSTVTEQIDETRTQIDETIVDLEDEITDQSQTTTDANSTNLIPTLVPTINPPGNTRTMWANDDKPTPTLTPTPTPTVIEKTDLLPTDEPAVTPLH